MKPKQTEASSTYLLKGGGVLHVDRRIMPIRVPRRLGAVPPLKPKGHAKVTKAKDEKIPTAETKDRPANDRLNCGPQPER